MGEILNIAHEMAQDLVKVGAMDEITMRKIDELCLPPVHSFQPVDVRRIRKENHVSQAVFAALLGIGKTTVQQWEQGQKKPSGTARRLLDLIDRKGLAVLWWPQLYYIIIAVVYTMPIIRHYFWSQFFLITEL